jgi:nitrogen fixation protein FixH
MGLDTTASHFVWFFAGVAVLGLGVQGMDIVHDLAEAREAADRLDQARLSTRLVSPTFCHRADAQQVVLNATNAGAGPIDVSGLTFVVDGIAATGAVSSWFASDVWGAGEHAEVYLEGVTAEPERLVVATREGAVLYPLKLDCPTVTTIVVAPSSASLLTGDAQTFTATAYDQYGTEVPATFAWSATRGTVDADGNYVAPATRGADTVTASVGAVQGNATISVTQTVHVDAMGTYNAGVASATFLRGETVEARVTLRDHDGVLVEGATVTVEFVRPSAQVASTPSDDTDAQGVASLTHLLPGNAQPGQWTVRVTSVTGSGIAYDAASNVVTSVDFAVN